MIDRTLFRDKIYGCWTGKNIGGTLGAPFEGNEAMNSVEFYEQQLSGEPAPNDDLDLQLVWLLAAEERGVYNLSPRVLGEYWLNHITAPWNEYSVCRMNIACGLYPPLSGSCNNEQWKWSNGAWIRSEIWACLFPGNPDEAIKFAYMDACADHTSEGIYAEMFTAALESAAFVVSDLQQLINISLNKVPEQSRIARAVRLVCEYYEAGRDYRETRAAVLKANEDLGFFQAPANIGFLVIGLLYGEGDFGKTICRAVNCGDDTDCTAATAGAIMGIILGRSGIPEKWIAPIGESIRTIAIDALATECPATISELTDRVIRLADTVRVLNPALDDFTSDTMTEGKLLVLTSPKVAELIWARSPYTLTFELPYGILDIEYVENPVIQEGYPKKLRLRLRRSSVEDAMVFLKWRLPQGWSAVPNSEMVLYAKRKWSQSVLLEQELIPGSLSGPLTFLELEVRINGRTNPVILTVPFQTTGTITYDNPKLNCGDVEIQILRRRGKDSSHVYMEELFF